uniref:BPL/LPL catalytic domain-containing protein n=1 Tax=Kalanchoe fedtschenkoi TaxID=63787 RepID=A0A7N0VGK3_KALFE
MAQTRSIGLPLMRVVRLEGAPILQQLHLEEKLLRTSSDNWCVVNDGTKDPTIVMGVSGKPAELLELDLVLRDHVPVIKRFTGGGTVIVDSGTVFVTFICNKDAVPGLQPYPRPIMSWSSLVYNEVFQGTRNFNLRENDYVFGNLKFGGNAQSITKNRWVHHTSFLWDFEEKNMSYLKHPAKAPDYRQVCIISFLCASDFERGFMRCTFTLQARSHLEFICRMKDYIPRSIFIDKTIRALSSHFTVSPTTLEEAPTDPHFEPSTKLLTTQDLETAASSSSP